MRRAWGAALLVGICVALLAPAGASGSTLPTGFRDDVVFAGLDEPTTFRFVPNSSRVFVAEKTGRILLFESVDDPTGAVFADLRTQVYDTQDRGLLGLEVDPAFPARPYVYALYTYDHVLGEPGGAPRWGEPGKSGDGCDEKPPNTGVDACPVSGRLVRLTVDEGGAGDAAVEDGDGPAEHVLVEDWCTQFSSHSIGDLEFGPDGWLYASGGEGADANTFDYGQLGWPKKNQCGDPPAGIGGTQTPPSAEGGALRAQDLRTPSDPLDPGADPTGLSGTVIRIDPDSGEGVPGNPLLSSLDPNERRIVGYGLRNPFRLALDPAGDRIYVSNVGWGHYEEIDRFAVDQAPIFNSGWPCYQGPLRDPSYETLDLDLCKGLYADPGAASPPFFHYRHGYGVVPEGGCEEQAEFGSAVSGLAFYPGGPFPPAYDGALFFADAARGCVFVMYRGDDDEPNPLTATTFMSDAGIYPGVDLQVGPDGALYYAQIYGPGFEPGSVRRVAYDPDAPRAELSASRSWWPQTSPQQVELDASASTDPGGKPLGFEWDFEGDRTFVPGAAKETKAFDGEENVEVAVRVGNGTKSSVARVTLYPENTPPEPEIEEPLGSQSWRVGDQIHFDGSAPDAEQGGINSSSLYWKTRLYHCPAACHAHPLRSFPSVGAGSFPAPDHDYPSHLEISLTAIDERGLSATETVAIYPRTVDLRIASDPPGVQLGAGLLAQPAPFDLTAIEGSSVSLAAPATALLGGASHSWLGWSDNGARVHTVVAEQPATYTAFYWRWPQDPPPPPGSPEPGPAERPRPKPSRPLISKHPAKRTGAASARFVFAAGGDSSFRCRLDGGEFKPCRSPRVYRGLRPGRHVLRVVAVDRVSGVSSEPAVYRWRVLRAAGIPAAS